MLGAAWSAVDCDDPSRVPDEVREMGVASDRCDMCRDDEVEEGVWWEREEDSLADLDHVDIDAVLVAGESETLEGGIGCGWEVRFNTTSSSSSELDDAEEDELDEELEDPLKIFAFFSGGRGGSGVGLAERIGLIVRGLMSRLSDKCEALWCLDEFWPAEPATKDVARLWELLWACDLTFDLDSLLLGTGTFLEAEILCLDFFVVLETVRGANEEAVLVTGLGFNDFGGCELGGQGETDRSLGTVSLRPSLEKTINDNKCVLYIYTYFI